MLLQVASFLLLNKYLHVAWSLHSIVNGETVSEASLSSLLMRRNALFEGLEYFLGTCSEGEEDSKCGNQLACRVKYLIWFYFVISKIYAKIYWEVSFLLTTLLLPGLHHTR